MSVLFADHDLRARRQLGGILRQLGVDGVEVRNGVAPLAAGDIDHMNEQAAAVDVAQEVVAEARTLRSRPR